jgi:xanthine/CO dehydrogenase XdhC/CoxF family maturation factor
VQTYSVNNKSYYILITKTRKISLKLLVQAGGEQHMQQVGLIGSLEKKKLFTMLVQARAGEAQAAKIKSKIAGISWGGAAQTASEPWG